MADTTITPIEYPVDNLIIAAGEVVERTIASGQGVIKRGTPMTLTAGKLVKAVADGDIHSIVKDDIDTTSEVTASVYYTGKYKRSVIEDVTGITITEAMQDTLRTNSIVLG